MPECPYPLQCKPVLKSKIWGGRKLQSLFGIPLPEGEKTGEAWTVADLPEGASTVANGPMQGKTLAEVTAEWKEDLIGPAWRGKPTGGRFPLLVKLLDAQDNLSIQVHPSQEDCKKDFPNDFSKDESWIVVASEKGGSILHGFKPGVTMEDFDRLMASGDVTECMRRFEVTPGEVFRVAPGTVHALCKGVVILEIQEPSDSTFRIYDYGRVGDDGRPRDLHLEASRKVMRFGEDQEDLPAPARVQREWGCHETLVDAPAYRIERLRPETPFAWEVDPRSAQVAIMLEGGMTLQAAGTTVRLKKGDHLVLPAVTGRVSASAVEEQSQLILAGAGGAPLA